MMKINVNSAFQSYDNQHTYLCAFCWNSSQSAGISCDNDTGSEDS